MTAAHRPLAAASLTILLVTGCVSDSTPNSSQPPNLVAQLGGEAPPPPPIDETRTQRGEILYQQQCASCHGTNLEGAADWKTRNDDGTWKPPPHDTSGHTWHHSDQLLTDIIRNGGGFPETRMPAFAAVLDTDAIDDILEYLRANWGQQERAFQWQVTWQETNQQ